MSSNRYRVIVGMLDDPQNVAAVKRELIRRGKKPLMPPPVPVWAVDGSKWGWVFPTMRQAMRDGLPKEFRPSSLDQVDAEIHVFTDGAHWFVALLNDGGAELGPFDQPAAALKEAKSWLKAEGYTLLEELPWDEDDVFSYEVNL
jgi:hypothetical protein